MAMSTTETLVFALGLLDIPHCQLINLRGTGRNSNDDVCFLDECLSSQAAASALFADNECESIIAALSEQPVLISAGRLGKGKVVLFMGRGGWL